MNFGFEYFNSVTIRALEEALEQLFYLHHESSKLGNKLNHTAYFQAIEGTMNNNIDKDGEQKSLDPNFWNSQNHR